ncbi:Arc family DNA-binding protein [Sphaerimonospora mesophila]|uniref:Arc family DNA-binding protein n=1 Tax=Sphaerimonospora mesophila TaxID=37483 RepID=UPI0006E306F6
MTRFTLRIPDDLYARIAASAKASHRSVNAHVLHLLEKGLAADAMTRPLTVADGEALVLLTVGDTAHVVTAMHPTAAPLQLPAQRIADQAGLPANDLPGRRFRVARLGMDDADGFTLLNDPRL